MYREQLGLFIVNEETSLVDAMQKIDDNANGIIFVVDNENRLCGAVSDGDIRRWILKAQPMDAKVESLMNKTPIFMKNGEITNPYAYMRKLSINALPLVDDKDNITDIILLKEEKQDGRAKGGLEGTSVIVMAGGKGTRLYPYTKILPKPLIPIGAVPIVERIMDSFYDYGISDFIMTVNYRKNMIRSYFCDAEKNYNLEYVEEDKPLGTAGSICLINRKFEKPIFVTNCDILIRTDYKEIYDYHLKEKNALTVVTALKNDIIPYGIVHSNENGEIESIEEKPSRIYMINTGMYIMNPELIDLIPEDTFFHMTHLTEAALEKGYKVGIYPVSEDSFLDMGEFEEMKRMEQKLNVE